MTFKKGLLEQRDRFFSADVVPDDEWVPPFAWPRYHDSAFGFTPSMLSRKADALWCAHWNTLCWMLEKYVVKFGSSKSLPECHLGIASDDVYFNGGPHGS